MSSYLLPTTGARFAFFDDEDTPEAASRMVAIIRVCPKNSVEQVFLRGVPNSARWKKALDEVDDQLTVGAIVRMASAQDIIARMTELDEKARYRERADIQRKIQEISNETYVNRVKTSDKQTKAVMDFIKG